MDLTDGRTDHLAPTAGGTQADGDGVEIGFDVDADSFSADAGDSEGGADGFG